MLADVLHKVAAMTAEERRESRYSPRPSLAGPERCIRQLAYFSRNEERRPLAGRAVVVMEDSSWHEELTADLIRKGAFQVHSEQMPINIPGVFPWIDQARTWECKVCGEKVRGQDCHGHIDFIVTDLLSQDILVEHKALAHHGFERLRKAEALPMDYLTQKAIYLRGSQRSNPDMRRGLLLVKNKNQSGYLEYLSEYDTPTDALTVIECLHHSGERVPINKRIDNITADAFAKFALVERHRREATLPERQYQIDEWQCEYCSYHITCWQGWVQEHAALSADASIEGELVDAIAYERELAATESEAKKERGKVRDEIKKKLREIGVRRGRAGDYIVDWTVANKKKLDIELLNEQNPGAYAAATVEAPVEKLTIKKPKEADNEKTGGSKRRSKQGNDAGAVAAGK